MSSRLAEPFDEAFAPRLPSPAPEALRSRGPISASPKAAMVVRCTTERRVLDIGHMAGQRIALAQGMQALHDILEQLSGLAAAAASVRLQQPHSALRQAVAIGSKVRLMPSSPDWLRPIRSITPRSGLPGCAGSAPAPGLRGCRSDAGWWDGKRPRRAPHPAAASRPGPPAFIAASAASRIRALASSGRRRMRFCFWANGLTHY